MKRMSFLILLVALLLWLSACENYFVAVINEILEQEKLPRSQHLSKCFTSTEDQQSNLILKKWIEMGRDSASTSLPSLPAKIQLLIKAKISQQTLSCILNSNDMITLFYHHFNIDFSLMQQMNKKFSSYSTLNFKTAHYLFANMSIESDAGNWSALASLIRELCEQVYVEKGQDQWVISAEQVEKSEEYYGISVSNGVIGAVSSRVPFRLSSTVLAGVYDKIGRGRVDNLVQTFPALQLQFSFNGQNGYYNIFQSLNMKESSMTNSFSGNSYSVSYTYYALRNLPFVFYTHFTVAAHEDGELSIKNIQQAPDHLLEANKNFEQIDTSKKIYSILSTEAKTKTGRTTLAIASSFLFVGEQMSIMHEDWDFDVHLSKFRKGMKKGDIFEFTIVTSLMSSSHHEDPLNQAIRMVIRATSLTNVLDRHREKWNQLWESDIVIEGNSVDQKNVRNMLYHCYSFLNEDRSYGVSPMGLSGLGYNGHIFWDMDLWIYPAILILKPELGRKMVEYRIDRLAAAKDNAFINGYKGAMYPWESSQSGAEETPVWAMSGPMQHHISGCVAFAVWNYYRVSQDINWLRNKGFEVIWSVAQFFASRVEIDKEGDFHIRNVVAADEWAENVDDDAFTNAIAITALDIANKAAKLLNYTENEKWKSIQNKIVILKMENKVTQQHSSYKGEPIKQADANLLSFPLKLVNKNEDILRDLQFYETRVPDAGTPAMTYSIFSLLYSRLKLPDQSYKNFKESHQQFLKKPFNVFSETKGGTNPYFLTGAGGVLQSVIYGFGGLEITDQGITTISTSIPKQWSRVSIKRSSSKNMIQIQ